MAREASSQGTDGDKVVAKIWGIIIIKFFKGALEIGAAVSAVILDKVRKASISMKEMMQFSDRRMVPLGS